MRAHSKESGFALILLIGITAALAILAATLVMLLDNQQHATAAERKTKTSLDYAEAALNSAVNACKNDTSWLSPGSTTLTSANLGANYPSGGPSVTYLIYDNVNPIDYSKTYDWNGDHEVWVETDTTWLGKVSKVRQLVSSSTKSSILPKAAAYADTDIVLSGSSNIYGVNADGSVDASGSPYITTIMAGQDFTGNSSTNLASPADGTHTQSLGLEANGTISTPGHSFNLTPGTVGLLSDYFDQAHQAALTAEAQSGMPTQATNTPSATTISTTLRNTLQGTSSQTYSTSTPLYYNGDLTLSAKSGASSTFTFGSLYVTGNLTITGNATVTTTALYVGKTFTVSGTAAAISDSFGATYCAGTIDWNGSTASGKPMLTISAGPLFAKILGVDGNSSDNSSYDGSSGPTTINLGPTWVDGDAGTGDVAVNFSGPTNTASTVMCPLLATTEQTHINGLVNLGTLTSPMVYFMQCDNDGLYNNTFQYNGTGTFTGLMVLFEAPINFTSGNVVGAVLEGTPVNNDITMSGSSSICYNQTAIDNCTSDSLRTTTVTTVPGSWQQLAN
jgi:Tfp pilus assembly protein PilX